jgi:hypothetical protein
MMQIRRRIIAPSPVPRCDAVRTGAINPAVQHVRCRTFIGTLLAEPPPTSFLEILDADFAREKRLASTFSESEISQQPLVCWTLGSRS